MQFLTLTTFVTLFAALTSAAPALEKRQRPFQAQITLVGAAAGSLSLSVPADGTVFGVTNPLSISKIVSLGGATCSFDGVDGSHTVVVGAQTVDVGPPQTQYQGSCLAF